MLAKFWSFDRKAETTIFEMIYQGMEKFKVLACEYILLIGNH